LATTNHFKTGGKDGYKLVKQVPVVKGSAIGLKFNQSSLCGFLTSSSQRSVFILSYGLQN